MSTNINTPTEDENHTPEVISVTREQYLDTVTELKEQGFEMCADVTSIDTLDAPNLGDGERFVVVANLLSLSRRIRVRVRVAVPEDDPVVPSLVDLYPGAEALEREVYDLMGIYFSGHPDLTRILLPDDWEGHPLRKDYDIGSVPVQFKFTEREYDTTRPAPRDGSLRAKGQMS